MLLARKLRKAHGLLRGLVVYSCQQLFKPCGEICCLFCVPALILISGFVAFFVILALCIILSPPSPNYSDFTASFSNYTPISPDRICDMIYRHNSEDVFEIFQEMIDAGHPITAEMHNALANCTERMMRDDAWQKWHAVDIEVSRPLPSFLPNPALHGYRVTIAPNVAVCGKHASKMTKLQAVLIYVYTAPDSVRHRQIVRQTWADTRQQLYSHFYYEPHIIFVLGTPASHFVQQQIVFEADAHGDILQRDFVDDYYNLTLKSLAAIEWAYDNCPGVHYFVKIDEDVFLNTFALLSFLSHRRVTIPRIQDEMPTLLCHIHEAAEVFRSGKYAVTYDEYPRKAYPNFCGGPAYVMNRRALEAIHKRSLTAHFFKLEDVFVTGLLAIAAHVNQVSIFKHYIFDGRQQLSKHVIDEQWTNFFFSHMSGIWAGDANQWFVVWNHLKRRALNAGGNYM